jgi:hypothetical protein
VIEITLGSDDDPWRTQIPDFLEDTAGESGVSPSLNDIFVIPPDVETVNLRSLQTNLWVNEGSDPPFANNILGEVGDLFRTAIY